MLRNRFEVEAAGFSITSSARRKNEDNMVINRLLLGKEHSDEYLESVPETDKLTAAVFDGIGGEPMGELHPSWQLNTMPATGTQM